MGETPPAAPMGGATETTRPRSDTRRADAEISLTVPRGRWRGLAAAVGDQPSVWGWGGAVPGNLKLGLQTDVLWTDNIAFDLNSRARDDAVIEVSPILGLDIGDPPAPGGFGAGSPASEYHAGLVYAPAFHHLLRADNTAVLHHFFSEAGRVTEINRWSLRLDYDERVLASSDDTSPEDAYTELEAGGLFEHHFTPKTSLRASLTYRDISTGDGFSDRSTWAGDLTAEWAATAKTTLGLGAALGHIRFDRDGAGTQDYQQALAVFRWRPSAKLSLTSTAGLERRAFDGAVARSAEFSPILAAAAQWQAAERTRFHARVRVTNEPSIVEAGAMFQEARVSMGAAHDFSARWYATGDLQHITRDYDSGHVETEPGARLAVGFRQDTDPAANRLNIEFYVHFRRRERDDIPESADRSQAGLRITRYF